MKATNNIDFNKFQGLNLALHTASSAPTSPVVGQTYFDSNLLYARVWDGTAWQRATFLTDPFARANHTGTQLAATISDFMANVYTARLDQLAAPTAAVALGSQRLTAVADPTSAQDAATKNYVDTVVSGKNYKDSVRVITTANITLSGTQTIDGVAVVAGDRVAVAAQTTGSQNGIYVVAAGAWSRATDADVSSEVTAGMTFLVDEGATNHDTQWTLTTDNPITLGTTALTFAKTAGSGGTTYAAGNGLSLTGSTFAVVPGAGILADGTSTRVDTSVVARKYTALIGDGTSTAITVTHSLGNQYVNAQVFDATTNAFVLADIVLASANTLTVTFGTAPAANAYRIVITG